jgi:hypothetical protein
VLRGIALMRTLAAWADDAIDQILISPFFRCCQNQWYLMAKCLLPRVSQGGSAFARVNARVLSSQIVDKVIDLESKS